MATKKVEKVEAETKAETKKAEIVEDDGMEEIFIPIDYSNPDELTEYIAVNGIAILVPKGQPVKVKKEYAAAWHNTEAEIKAQFAKRAERVAAENNYTQGYINSTN